MSEKSVNDDNSQPEMGTQARPESRDSSLSRAGLVKDLGISRPTGDLEGDLKANKRVLLERGITIKRAQAEPDMGDGIVQFVACTEGIKRDGNRVRNDGWSFDNFSKNPQFLWCHDYGSLPIGKHVDWKVDKMDGEPVLRLWSQFCSEDLYPFADKVRRMYEEGFLRAGSIGWIPLEYETMVDRDGYTVGFDFLKNDLLEFSAVPVPSDPNALIEAVQRGVLSSEDMERLVRNRKSVDNLELSYRLSNRNHTEDESSTQAVAGVEVAEEDLGNIPDPAAEMREAESVNEEVSGGNVVAKDALEGDIIFREASEVLAKDLIGRGFYDIDSDSEWEFSVSDGNELLGKGEELNWERYGSVHLARDEDYGEGTRDHYKYPFGKMRDGGLVVFASGLNAIRSQSGERDEAEVFEAAGRLLEEVKAVQADVESAETRELASEEVDEESAASGEVAESPEERGGLDSNGEGTLAEQLVVKIQEAGQQFTNAVVGAVMEAVDESHGESATAEPEVERDIEETPAEESEGASGTEDLVEAAEAYINSIEENIEARVGAKVSKANKDRLCRCRDKLSEVVDDLDKIMEERKQSEDEEGETPSEEDTSFEVSEESTENGLDWDKAVGVAQRIKHDLGLEVNLEGEAKEPQVENLEDAKSKAREILESLKGSVPNKSEGRGLKSTYLKELVQRVKSNQGKI